MEVLPSFDALKRAKRIALVFAALLAVVVVSLAVYWNWPRPEPQVDVTQQFPMNVGPADRALVDAIARGDDTTAISTILDASPDALHQAVAGRTALQWAIRRGDIGLITLLLDRGARVNVRPLDSRSRDTALHTAVRKRDIAIVQLLVDRGARLDEVNADGQTAYDLAVEFKGDDIAAIVKPPAP